MATSNEFITECVDTYLRNGAGWAVGRDGDERFISVGLTQEQADYAAMVLNAGGIDTTGLDRTELGDEVELLTLYTNCTQCEGTFMQGTLDDSKRCDACAS